MVDENDIDRALEALKKEEKKKRRQAEKTGGFIIMGAGLIMIVLFLWALAISPKRPLDLVMALVVAGIGIALVAWGLFIAIIGRNK